MDDCDLEKLTAAPAKLFPKFNRAVCEYTSTVPSKVEKVNVDCLTRDSGASYQIIGSGGERVIPLKEGCVNEIKIEVTAEDGTMKYYILNIKRLSASEAILTSLSVAKSSFDPVFTPETYEYCCTLPNDFNEVTITATAPEKTCEILLNSQDIDVPLKLNCGETESKVSVQSVDKSQTKDYVISFNRKQLLWPILPKNLKEFAKFECPMTLAPLYCPISIRESEPKVTMSQPCLDMLTRRSKVNPFDETPLDKDWRIVDVETDKFVTNMLCISPFSYKGCKDDITLNNVAEHAITSEFKAPDEPDNSIITNSEWYKAEFESSSASSATKFNHKIEIRNWEKRLQHMAAGGNPEQLVKDAQNHIKKYRLKLPKKPGDRVSYENGESPNDHLQQAAICYAAAIKLKPKEVDYHLSLGRILEEQYYFDDIYELDKKNSTEDHAGTNLEAQETSKEDDITAICKLRGVGAHAPLAMKLKAIDEEYHHLLDSGNSSKADYVQLLYAWKSKQALKEGQAVINATDDSNTLGQASLKYMDALAANTSNFAANLEVGRMYFMQEKYDDAIIRLQQALGMKPSSVVARFYLGISIYKQLSGAGERLKESLTLMHDGLNELLAQRLKEACSTDANQNNGELLTANTWRIFNTDVLRGLLTLAGALQKNPTEGLRPPKEIYHLVCLQASAALCSMYAHNDLFRQLEHILLDCHYALLNILIKECPKDTEWIAHRCHYLSAIIRSVSISQSIELMKLQQSVCQKLVTIQPCSSKALYLLGMIQLAQYDHDSNSEYGKNCLSECRATLKASIVLEGKPASGSLPESVADQKWWKDKVAEDKAKLEKEAAAKAPPASSSKTFTKPAPVARGRGTPRGRGSVAARGASAPRARGARGTARGRGATVPAATPITTKAPEEATSTSHPGNMAPVDPNAPINKVTFHARLGLARALSRTSETIKDAQGQYEEVIKMAPEIHDAYIELADILVKTDPLEAVNVYCRFPQSKYDEGCESFDDAYLSGEIVRILMKHEKYDDPRLCEHMVAWGRIMGIGILEKYMGILDEKFKTNLLKSVYAGVHRKDINDEALQDFFKFKCWI